MKQFLTKMLSELEARTGIRQLYFLQQKPDAGNQVNILLDSMVRVCQEYNYIPELNQKAIIQKEMERDQNYDGLSARILRRWFDLHKDLYWNKPVSEVQDVGEITPETQKMINEFIAKLSQGPKAVPSVSGYEVQRAKERPKIEAVSIGHGYSTEEDHRLLKARVEYGRLYHHPHTGAKLDNWISFDDYLKTRNEPHD